MVGNVRRRVPEGVPQRFAGICTNRLGRVRACKNLLTPMNYRRVYLRTDGRLPRNLLMALTIDVSDTRLQTLNARNVTTYYYKASDYVLSAFREETEDDEVIDSDMAVTWMRNVVEILNNLNMCGGRMTVPEVIDDKYCETVGMRPGELERLVNRTVGVDGEYYGLQEALLPMTSIARRLKPTDIRIWGVVKNDDVRNVSKYKDNIFLGEARKNNVRVYPLGVTKRQLADTVIDDDDDDNGGEHDNGAVQRNRRVRRNSGSSDDDSI